MRIVVYRWVVVFLLLLSFQGPSRAMFMSGSGRRKVHRLSKTFSVKHTGRFRLLSSGRFLGGEKRRRVSWFDVYFSKPPLSPMQKKALGRFASQIPAFTVRFDTITGLPVFIKGEPLYSASTFSSLDFPRRVAIEALNRLAPLLRLKNPDRVFFPRHGFFDSTGRYHLRLTERYRGIPYFGKELVVHLDAGGRVYLVEGHYNVIPEGFNSTPAISATEACVVVTSRYNEVDNCSRVDLVIYDDDAGVPRLSWKVEVCGGDGCWRYFVDARNGVVFKKYKLVYDAAVPGSGVDQQTHTSHSFSVWEEGGEYYFIDTSLPIHRSDPSVYAQDFGKGNIVVLQLPYGTPDAGVAWLTSYSPDSWPENAVSVWYGLKKTLEYYMSVHNRCSMDGKCESAVGVIGLAEANAFYASEYNDFMFFGTGDGYQFAPLTAVDVIAHEFTHGVTNYSARLEYQFQSGALNEAFSDIFAAMVDRDDWTIGEDVVMVPPYNLRDLADPHNSLNPQPENMEEYQDLPIDQDNGGVHINSTIPSHVAYLVAKALGRDKAEKIFYRTLTVHLTPQSDFGDFCRAAVQSAEELYGDAEAQAVRNACEQVGISVVVSGGGEEQLPTVPALQGKDYLLVIFYQQEGDEFVPYVGILKPGDSTLYYLSETPVEETRPAPFYYEGQEWALFVDRNNNLRAANVESEYYEEFVMNDSGEIWSVATTPSADKIVYTSIYDDDNNIYVLDTRTNEVKAIPIKFRSPDSSTEITTLFPDVVSFAPDGRTVFFDCYNVVKFGNMKYEFWTVGKLDLLYGTTSLLMPVPPEGYHIGDPAAGHVHPELVAYDIWTSGHVTTRILNLATGRSGLVLEGYTEEGVGTSGWPSFSGDDRYIYLQYLDEHASGEVIVRVELENSGGIWSGKPDTATVVLEDAEGIGVIMPVAFRPGVVDVSPVAEVSPASLDFGNVGVGRVKALYVELKNVGNYPLEFMGTEVEGSSYFISRAVHTTVDPGKSYSVRVEFKPEKKGTFEGVLKLYTSDPSHKVLSVALRGTGVIENQATSARPLPTGPVVGMVNDPASAPVRIAGGKVQVDLRYQGSVDVVVGVATGDFRTIYWLNPDSCSFSLRFAYALGVSGVTCEDVPVPITSGYVFWVASVSTGSPFEELNENGRYELMFYPF